MSAHAARETVEVLVIDLNWRTAMPRCRSFVAKAASAALAHRKRRGAAGLSVVLADDRLVRRLNRDYRGYDKPTNVLAFAEDEADNPDPSTLGDVVLARRTVAREAKAQGKTFAQHVAHLVVHGTLHLLGFDHVRKADALRMEAAERRILADIGIPDPYAIR